MVSGRWQTSNFRRIQPHLQVGLTDYKDHMGTNLSPEVDKWVGNGEHR